MISQGLQDRVDELVALTRKSLQRERTPEQVQVSGTVLDALNVVSAGEVLPAIERLQRRAQVTQAIETKINALFRLTPEEEGPAYQMHTASEWVEFIFHIRKMLIAGGPEQEIGG